jgi:hypothetical protein
MDVVCRGLPLAIVSDRMRYCCVGNVHRRDLDLEKYTTISYASDNNPMPFASTFGMVCIDNILACRIRYLLSFLEVLVGNTQRG